MNLRHFIRDCTLVFSAAILASLPSQSDGGELAHRYELVAPPKNGLLSNSVIDIIEHNGAVWLATGKGINFSNNNGLSWQFYNTSNGLVSDNVSALYSSGNRLWTGTNHEETVSNQLVTASDGVSYTDNDGDTWTTIDFNSTGQNINFVTGGNRTIFDITGANNRLEGPNNDWVFFAAFAGGFLASRDGGINWRRIFPSTADSAQYYAGGQPSLENRYFSAVADTTHHDSLLVWTGTAGGVFQYVFSPNDKKLYIRGVNRLAVCDSCLTTNSLFLGGTSGVAVGRRSGSPFFTRTVVDGLPGPNVTAIIPFADRLFVGTSDNIAVNSTGLAISADGGNSYSVPWIQPAIGTKRIISDFASIDSRLYLAGQQNGLLVTGDTGSTWTRILIDSAQAGSAVNTVNALKALGDTLYVGTDTGFAALYLDPAGSIDSLTRFAFVEDANGSTKIIRIAIQQFSDTATPTLIDSTAIWLVHRPATVLGNPTVTFSLDRGASFMPRIVPPTNDLSFVGDTIFVLTNVGVRYFVSLADEINDPYTIIDSLDASLRYTQTDTINTGIVLGDTIYFATQNGIAISVNRGKKYKIHRANFDSLRADQTLNHTFANSARIAPDTTIAFGILGDFNPAIGVQYRGPDSTADIWVSGRPVSSGGDGISRGRFKSAIDSSSGFVDTLMRLEWDIQYEEDFAWNFGFRNDTIFAATNIGLLRYVENRVGSKWDTIPLVNSTTNEPLLDPETAIFAAEVIGDYLWVGTGDGTIRILLTDTALTDQRLFGVVDSTTPSNEVYAYPVPFSPSRGGSIDFHFTVENAGNVTIEVYDFAMNLVARPIDNLFYSAGIYPNGSSQGRTWDGLNGKGEIVAVGVYYFKVLTDSGERRWGKLAVIP